MATRRGTQEPDDDGRKSGEPPVKIHWPAADRLAGASLTDLLRTGLDSATEPRKKSSKTWAQQLVENLIRLAIGGDLRANQEIWTRLEGKPGSSDPAARTPVEVDDELAQLILDYERKKTHSGRAEDCRERS